MHALVQRHAVMQRQALEAVAERTVVGNQAGAPAPGDGGIECRAIAGLGRQREVVALPQSRQQAQALHRRRPRRHDDRFADVGIALENAFGAAKHQRVD
jgi:hypothetical protein